MFIIHKNYGALDIRAITTFGLNAKPNTKSPIGYFGTGLKYAIATLLRNGLDVSIWINEKEYIFHTEKREFRGVDHSAIFMRRKRGATARWFTEALPYTTSLGKNWALWMALRELHSNALDEGGGTETAWQYAPKEDATAIIVKGKSYTQVYDDLNNIFLPDADRTIEYVQILSRPAEHVYYRGLRAYDLQRKSINTYSINAELELTEDRTIKLSYMIDYYIKKVILQSTDKKMIKSVVTAGDDTYESGLSWHETDKTYATPEFLETVRLYGKRTAYVIFIEKVIPPKTTRTWHDEYIDALGGDDDVTLLRITRENRHALTSIVASAKKLANREMTPVQF